MNWARVAKDLLAISYWPWRVVKGADEPMINDVDGYAVASISGIRPDASFIAHAPRLLAEALVERIEVCGGIPELLGISPADYAKIKRRLDTQHVSWEEK